MMAPCSGFYAEPATGRKQVRLAYVLEQPLLKKAVECLREALAAYPGTDKAAMAKAVAIG
jgi:aspartate aminotransferase